MWALLLLLSFPAGLVGDLRPCIDIGSRCASLGINYAEIDDALVTLGNKRGTTATTRPSFPPFVPSSTLCCSRSAAAVLHVARVHPSPVVGQARSGWFQIFQAIFGLLSGGWNRSATTCPSGFPSSRTGPTRLRRCKDPELGPGGLRGPWGEDGAKEELPQQPDQAYIGGSVRGGDPKSRPKRLRKQ